MEPDTPDNSQEDLHCQDVGDLHPPHSRGSFGDGVYSQLDRSRLQTRLLSFIEISDPRNKMMALSLETVDLENESTPEYFALSYEWTPPGTDLLLPHVIIINGIGWSVSPNLYSALTHLQHILSASNTKRIWIDALCINQEDISERSHQVSFMMKIYSGAESVLVWPGLLWVNASANSTPSKVQLLQELEDDSKRMEQHSNDPEDDDLNDLEDEDSAVYFGQGDHFAAAVELFSLSYWKRCWIVQEIAVAKSAFIIAMWNKRVVQLHFRHLLARMMLDIYIDPSSPPGKRLVPASFKDRKLEFLDILSLAARISYTSVSRGQGDNTLLSLLERFSTQLSSNPCDLVYSLAGLEEPASTMKIDYNLELRDVFTNAAIHIIQDTRDLSVLAFGGTAFGLPSWVPDWRTARQTRHLIWGDADIRVLLSKSVEGIRTAPAGKSEPEAKGFLARISDDRTRLTVAAYLFDIDLETLVGLRRTGWKDELDVLDDLVEGYFHSSSLPDLRNDDRRLLFRMSAALLYNSLFSFNDWAREKLPFERFWTIARERCIGGESTTSTDEEREALRRVLTDRPFLLAKAQPGVLACLCGGGSKLAHPDGNGIFSITAKNPRRILLSGCLGKASNDQLPDDEKCVLAAIPGCAFIILLRKAKERQHEYQVITWAMKESENDEALKHAADYGVNLQKIILI